MPVDAYVAAFLARGELIRRRVRPESTEPGVSGLLPSVDDPQVRLLVTDDRAREALAGVLADAESGLIVVFEGWSAATCKRYLRSSCRTS